MRPKELFKLLLENQDKFELIDTIMDLHPSYGIDRGWSWYQGGMKDSGDWYIERLLRVPIGELKSFLIDHYAHEELRKQKNSAFEALTKEEQMNIIKKDWEEAKRNFENYLMWGKTINR